MNSWTALYAKAVVEVGEQLHIPVVNVYDKLMSVPDWEVSATKQGVCESSVGVKYPCIYYITGLGLAKGLAVRLKTATTGLISK